MAVKKALLVLEGTRPLLWHHFGPDAISGERKAKTGVAGNDRVEWKKTVLVTEEGQLYIEPSYIFGMMREAGRYTVRSRQSMKGPISATLQVIDDRVLIDRYLPGFDGELPDDLPDDPNLPVYLDIRGVKNPATKGRNVRYRVAASTGWQTSFSILWEDSIVQKDIMEAVAIDAGRLVGLGDGRSIGFGRFAVKSFSSD